MPRDYIYHLIFLYMPADIDLSMKKRVLHYVWDKYMYDIQEPDRNQLLIEDVECFYDALWIKDEQERSKVLEPIYMRANKLLDDMKAAQHKLTTVSREIDELLDKDKDALEIQDIEHMLS